MRAGAGFCASTEVGLTRDSSFLGDAACDAIDAWPRARTVTRQGFQIPLAVIAMLFSSDSRRTRHRALIGVRNLEILRHHTVFVRDARRIEEGDLNRGLELDVQEVEQIELVLRRLRVESDNLCRQPISRPCSKRHDTKPAGT